MDILADLEARGLLRDSTDRAALAKRLAEGPITLYFGCDPTADSLHHGNLVGLLVCRRFREAGHRPIALVGGATGMVGDPSGRSEERNLLDDAVLAHNVSSIKAQVSQILGDAGEWDLVDNRDWTADVGLLEFLRDVGKHVTVNTMLHKESVRARLGSEHGISFTEFSYMLLQAHDYLRLYEERGCELQIGGSDQWGNIALGVDLCRRAAGATVHAFTWPLITKADGTKFGKTADGALWLGAHRTSPYRFFQYWMQADDRDVAPWLRVFTFLPLEEVETILAEHERAPERRLAQRVLAREVTTVVHGSEHTAAAEEASAILFGSDLADVSEGALAAIAGEVPTAEVSRADLLALPLSELLADRTTLASSRSDARRSLEQGGVYVNNHRASTDRTVAEAELLFGRYVLLRKGKRSYQLVVAEAP
ncbi:MAG: tyrosine--tRNA ligase [Actinomycetota bacterium]